MLTVSKVTELFLILQLILDAREGTIFPHDLEGPVDPLLFFIMKKNDVMN